MTLPNGVVMTYSYDSDARIAAITYSNASGPLGNLTYNYDANGRVVRKGGSLASIVMPQPVSGNTYNAANEMQNLGAQSLTYDTNGNLLSDGTNSYAWDARNQLTSLTGPAPAGFTYDSFGRRVSLTVNGGTTQYLYESGGPLAQEISPAGVHLMSGLGTSRLDSGGAMTFLSDESGSVIALTDQTGTIQTQYSYGPLGNVSITGAASTNPYQFDDMENDGTGVYYRSGSFYSPNFGLAVNGNSASGGASANATPPASNGSCDKCQAELKYHLVDYPVLKYFHYNHAFWDVHLADGGPGTIYSGQPSKVLDGTYSILHPLDFGYLARYEWQDNSPQPSGVSDKSTDRDSYDSGCSSDVCQAAQLLDMAASLWPQGQIAYKPNGGPNSNTLANHLGLCGGFPNGPAPGTEGEGGWNNAVAQQVPCL
jgi:YD repeat-containing protein